MKLNIKISGAYHSRFGNLEQESLYSLYGKALKGVIKDAAIDAESIDGVFVANYSGGSFNNQENISPYGVNVLPQLRFKPFYRIETACSSGSSAIQMAIMALKSGMMNRVVVVGVEKMNSLDIAGVTKALSKATFWPDEGARNVTAPCMFADLGKGWMKNYKIGEDRFQEYMAKLSSKAYRNASSNPLAQLQKAKSAEDILNLPPEKNPTINYPLRLHDCSLVSDGAAALILERKGAEDTEGIVINHFYNASDYLDSFGKNKSDHFLEGAAFAVNKVLGEAKTDINSISLAEVHDCFTVTEMLLYSALGLKKAGREYEAIEEGLVESGGKLPVNLSGGLKAKGHPIGATGVAMHAYIYQQLKGEAYNLQVENPEKGLVVNIGGSGTSNAVSLLERF